MSRVTLKYLLTICVLLLNGYHQLSAHPHKKIAFYYSIKGLRSSEYRNLETLQSKNALFVNFNSCDTENLVFFENEEDDELISFKKHLKADSRSTIVFHTVLQDVFFKADEKHLISHKHFSPTSLNRYLLLKVFRV